MKETRFLSFSFRREKKNRASFSSLDKCELNPFFEPNFSTWIYKRRKRKATPKSVHLLSFSAENSIKEARKRRAK